MPGACAALMVLPVVWGNVQEGIRETDPLLLEAAVAGLGVAMLPTFLVGPSIDKGEVLPLLLDFPAPPLGLYVVRPPPAAHMPAKVRALTDLLIERFGGEPFWDACYARRVAAGLPA